MTGSVGRKVCMCVCVRTCMHAHVCELLLGYIEVWERKCVCMHVCVHVCLHACIRACVCVSVCVCVALDEYVRDDFSDKPICHSLGDL